MSDMIKKMASVAIGASALAALMTGTLQPTTETVIVETEPLPGIAPVKKLAIEQQNQLNQWNQFDQFVRNEHFGLQKDIKTTQIQLGKPVRDFKTEEAIKGYINTFKDLATAFSAFWEFYKDRVDKEKKEKGEKLVEIVIKIKEL